MKNIKNDPRAIELHKVCMECIDALVKSGYKNDVALNIIEAYINTQCNLDVNLLMASMKMQFLNESIRSATEEIISKILHK